MRQAGCVELGEQASEACAWLREHGFEVRVEERNLREEFLRRGLRGADTIDHPYWADLVGIANPDFVVPNYGSGVTPEQAIIRARKRYASEQT